MERKPPPDFIYDPPICELDVVFADDDLLVLSKPSGLLSVPGRKAEHADSLERRAQEQFPQARIVHRLDMDTSGLMVMALNASSHREISRQFEQRKTRKEYRARVWGHPQEDEGEIDLPLRCDWPNRPLQMVDHELGKVALTRWRVLEREDSGFSRIALYPHTGRTHQLRVHMAEIGHPILGDDFYAHEDGFKAADRLQLHALRLVVFHPDTGEELSLEAPCPF